MENKTYTCDIDGCNDEAKHLSKNLQIIFTSDQTEGRSCAPYLSANKLDLCDVHMKKILSERRYITAYGAQGFNTYFFEKLKSE